MATGETGFDDVTVDLISMRYHSLKAGHDYGQYVRDAKNAGLDDVAPFFSDVMARARAAMPRVLGPTARDAGGRTRHKIRKPVYAVNTPMNWANRSLVAPRAGVRKVTYRQSSHASGVASY